VNKIFLGSAELVLARLVSDRTLSQEELDRMRALLDEAEEQAQQDGERALSDANDDGGTRGR